MHKIDIFFATVTLIVLFYKLISSMMEIRRLERYDKSLYGHLKRLSKLIKKQQVSSFLDFEIITAKILYFDNSKSKLSKKEKNAQMDYIDALSVHEINALQKVIVALESNVPVTNKEVTNLINEITYNLDDIYEKICSNYTADLSLENHFYKKLKRNERENEITFNRES